MFSKPNHNKNAAQTNLTIILQTKNSVDIRAR